LADTIPVQANIFLGLKSCQTWIHLDCHTQAPLIILRRTAQFRALDLW
jgi:hypothetical protein